VPYVSNTEWRFKTGAVITFAHIGNEKEKYLWRGAQIPYLGFDQLEDFSESVFFYMLSRNRSTCGVKPCVRCTVNPDAESWVAKFIAWWINQDTGYPLKERAGKIRWMLRVANDEIAWADTREELVEKYKTSDDPDDPSAPRPKSVTFIPATIFDNKIGLAKDPEYLGNLQAQSLIERERLLNGNWKIKASAGKVFNRGWFETVPDAPAGGVECRFWDFAATEKKLKGDDPDWTAGVKIRFVNGLYYVMDSTAGQWGPTEGDRIFINTTLQDVESARRSKTEYRSRWEIEPGAAAKKENIRLMKLLAGLNCKGIPAAGDKITRAIPFANQAEVGNVRIVAGDWNDRFLTLLHHQPDWPHDDEMDGASGAFNELAPIKKRGVASSQQG